ncbi:MAG: TetR/AcrR family transcriptional regulator [Bacteroidia bacterium]|nr:TetR/AcrR family transcriptional regulator [Bacteroidia bacterium]
MNTRDKILHCIYEDMKLNGFQGLRPDNAIKKIGLSKGAMYHYFHDKPEIGYLIVEEIIQPEYLAPFIPLLSYEGDPIDYIQNNILQVLKESTDPKTLVLGSPVFNLVQEMAPLDEEFRTRLEIILETARDILSDGIRRGKENGTVVPHADPIQIACFVQSSLAGIYTLAKISRDINLFISNLEMISDVLDGFRQKS